MKIFLGNVLYGLAKFLDLFLGGVIFVFSMLVSWVEKVRFILAPFLLIFFFFVFINPFSLLLFMNRWIWIFFFILAIFPFLGKSLISFLDYGKYVLTEYLYDHADFYRLGKNSKKDFASYGPRYWRQKQAEVEEEARRRQQRQKEEWDRIFEEFYRSSGFNNYNHYRQSGSYQQSQGQASYNPFGDFMKQYRESCDVLGVSYNTDSYEVKLQYRKLAKKYHPDINKDPSATQKFQKINAAYAFLSAENIERYKKMQRG